MFTDRGKTSGPYPVFFLLWGGGGGHFSQNRTFSSINVIAYIGIIQDEMLENVILVILRRKIGYAVYALIFFLLCKYSAMKRIVAENMDFQIFFCARARGGGGLSFGDQTPPPPPPGTGLNFIIIFNDISKQNK